MKPRLDGITREAIVAAILAAQNGVAKTKEDDPGLTKFEIADILGCSADHAVRRIRELWQQGIVQTGTRRIQKMGVKGMYPVPVYYVRKGKK